MDYSIVTVALGLAADAAGMVGDLETAETFRRCRRRVKAEAETIRENARPAMGIGGGRLPRGPITAEMVARHLARPVSRVRDDGGKVVLAWIPGVGCRFVSKRKVLAA